MTSVFNRFPDRFQNYTEMIGLNRFLWHGDIKRSQKNTFIRNPTTVLMTTPESLEGMLISSSLPHQEIFADLRAIVIDEIHALAGSDRGSHLMSVLERLLRVTNYDVQRIGLSATVGNPDRILQWRQGTSQRPSCVIDPPPIPSKKEIRILLVELARRHWVESVKIIDRNWAVLVQQLLAMTMQFGATSPEDCWQQLSIVPDFQGINRAEFNRLIRHMLATDYLYLTRGLLSIGTQTEKVFGSKNFLALYAVFSTPANYEVQTIAGQHIGSLDRHFVDTLTLEKTCFLLGGRAWIANFIHHPDRTVEVTAAPQGKKPKWGEFMLDILSWEICQEIAIILNSSHALPYLDPCAQIALTECCIELGRHTGNKIYWESDRAIWWTFAGQRINQSLKYGLEYLYDWKIKVDNFNLSIVGDSLNSSALATAIEQILEPEFWQAQEIQNYLLDRIPNYHLSKFQQVLPDRYALEIVQNYLLDIDGISKLSGIPATL